MFPPKPRPKFGGPSPADIGAPGPIGGPPPIPPKGMPPKGAPDDAPPAGGDGDLTPDMLDYHGPEESCQGCKHFSGPSTCDRWPDPVDPGGHCEGFQPGGEQENPDENAAEGGVEEPMP